MFVHITGRQLYAAFSAYGHVLDEILRLSAANITVETDKARYRPADVPIIEADISKLQECTGWKPEIGLNDTLKETLRFWRENI